MERPPPLALLAGDKVVPARAVVGDERVKAALRVEDDAVGAGRAAGVDLEAGQDGELEPRGPGGEVEALAVVVLVGIASGACGLAIQLLAQTG